MDKNELIDKIETIDISNDELDTNEILNEELKEENFEDDFTPDEIDDNNINYNNLLTEVANKLEVIDKKKINIDEFYEKINFNYLEIISQKIFIRNLISFKFNFEITFYALDLQFCIYDLFIDKTFANTIDWVNYIEKYYYK
jgi:hypothetical protein